MANGDDYGIQGPYTKRPTVEQQKRKDFFSGDVNRVFNPTGLGAPPAPETALPGAGFAGDVAPGGGIGEPTLAGAGSWWSRALDNMVRGPSMGLARDMGTAQNFAAQSGLSATYDPATGQRRTFADPKPVSASIGTPSQARTTATPAGQVAGQGTQPGGGAGFQTPQTSPETIGDQAATKFTRYAMMGLPHVQAMQAGGTRMMEAGDMPLTDMYQGVQANMMGLLQSNPELFQGTTQQIQVGTGPLDNQPIYATRFSASPIERIMKAQDMMLRAQGTNRQTMANLYTQGYAPMAQEEARQRGATERAPIQAMAGMAKGAGKGQGQIIAEGLGDIYKANIPMQEIPGRVEGYLGTMGYGPQTQPEPQPEPDTGPTSYMDVGIDPQSGKPIRVNQLLAEEIARRYEGYGGGYGEGSPYQNPYDMG